MLVRAWFILMIAERFGYINSIWNSINATGKINPHRPAPPHPSWNLLTEDKLCLSTPLVEKDRVEAADEQNSSVFLGLRINLMASPIPKKGSIDITDALRCPYTAASQRASLTELCQAWRSQWWCLFVCSFNTIFFNKWCWQAKFIFCLEISRRMRWSWSMWIYFSSCVYTASYWIYVSESFCDH